MTAASRLRPLGRPREEGTPLLRCYGRCTGQETRLSWTLRRAGDETIVDAAPRRRRDCRGRCAGQQGGCAVLGCAVPASVAVAITRRGKQAKKQKTKKKPPLRFPRLLESASRPLARALAYPGFSDQGDSDTKPQTPGLCSESTSKPEGPGALVATTPWCEFTILEGNHVYTLCKSIARCPDSPAFPNASVINQIEGGTEPD